MLAQQVGPFLKYLEEFDIDSIQADESVDKALKFLSRGDHQPCPDPQEFIQKPTIIGTLQGGSGLEN